MDTTPPNIFKFCVFSYDKYKVRIILQTYCTTLLSCCIHNNIDLGLSKWQQSCAVAGFSQGFKQIGKL